ncbi:hypothetical protein GCM10028798_03040 [Humibacter antri]
MNLAHTMLVREFDSHLQSFNIRPTVIFIGARVVIRFTSRWADSMYTLDAAHSRRLVLVDIENIVGGGVTMARQVHDAETALVATVGRRPDDQDVVACGRLSADVVGFEWQGARRFVFRPGLDGADLELLEILETERISERFAEIVLASGDGIFAHTVSALGAAGVDVTIAARSDACSRRLRMAAAHTVYLDYHQDSFLETA